MLTLESESIVDQRQARALLVEHSIELDPMDHRNSVQFVTELLMAIEHNLGEITLQHEIDRFGPPELTTGQRQFLNLTQNVKRPQH